jgi:hypothetical protein
LKAFKKEHGHCNVPMRYPPNRRLGHWVNGIRQQKRRGALAKEKIIVLDGLGFSWLRRRRGIMVPWEQRIEDLKAFKKEHGHCNVLITYKPCPTLGRWAQNVRARRKRGELTEEQILSLDALGFRWKRQERSSKSRGK